MIFLILVPFAAFAGLTMVASAPVSLFGAAAVALATIAWDLSRGASIKILASGAAILFVALGCYLTLIDSTLSTPSVRLAVDSGVLVIALLSIVLRYPGLPPEAFVHPCAEAVREFRQRSGLLVGRLRWLFASSRSSSST